MGQQASQDPMDLQVHKEFLDHQALKENKGIMVCWVLLDLQVNQVNLDQLEPREVMAFLGLLVLKEGKGVRAEQVLQDCLDLQEKMASMVSLDHRVPRERRESSDCKGHQEQEESQDLRGLRAMLVHQDFLATLVNKVLKVSKENPANLVIMESRVILVLLVIQVQEAILVHRELLARRDNQDLLVVRGTLVFLETKVTLDLWVNQDLLDPLANKVYLVLKEPLVLEEIRVQLEKSVLLVFLGSQACQVHLVR